MSGNHRKVSRSIVDNSLTVNSGTGCHFKQPENELKQKLDALDTSFKISNKKISNETRELKQILFDLQRDLKDSKSSNYVPSILEEQRGQVKRHRRITVASTSHDTISTVNTGQASPRSPKGDSAKRQRKISSTAYQPETSTSQASPRGSNGDSAKRQRKISSTTYQPATKVAAVQNDVKVIVRDETAPQSLMGDSTSSTTHQPERKGNEDNILHNERKGNGNEDNVVIDSSRIVHAEHCQMSSEQQLRKMDEYKESNDQDSEKSASIKSLQAFSNSEQPTSSVDNESNQQRKEASNKHNTNTNPVQRYLLQPIASVDKESNEQRRDDSEKYANRSPARENSNPLQPSVSLDTAKNNANNRTDTEVNSRRDRKISQPGMYSYSLATDSKADHTSSSNKASSYGLTYSKHFNEDRKRSLSDSDANYRDAFRGRFVTHSLSEKFKDGCSIDVTSLNQQKRTRRVTVASSTPPVGLRRPIDVADFPTADSRGKKITSGRGHMGLLSTHTDVLDDVFDSNEKDRGKNSLTVGRKQDSRQRR